MPGLSRGITSITIIGARVARALTFVPGYPKPGAGPNNAVQPKCFIPVAVNPVRGNNASFFTITAWGPKVTQFFCNYLEPGKEIHFIDASVSTYKAQITDKAGNLLNNPDSTPLEIDKFSITCNKFLMGSDSADMIAREDQVAMAEIAQGLRGPNWKVPNHPDRVAFLARMKQIMEQPYVPGSPTYGKANVSKKALAMMGNNAYNPAGYPAGYPGGTGTIVDPNASVPNVGGITYDMLIKGGWTDPQIAANPQYAVLKVAHDKLMAAGAAITGGGAGTFVPPPPAPGAGAYTATGVHGSW